LSSLIFARHALFSPYYLKHSTLIADILQIEAQDAKSEVQDPPQGLVSYYRASCIAPRVRKQERKDSTLEEYLSYLRL